VDLIYVITRAYIDLFVVSVVSKLAFVCCTVLYPRFFRLNLVRVNIDCVKNLHPKYSHPIKHQYYHHNYW
jgi:hypothetical protein